MKHLTGWVTLKSCDTMKQSICGWKDNIYIYIYISRNWNKKICEHKKDFKTGKTTKSLVSHNILTNHTFDFQNSTIVVFIHDKNKRRIIEVYSIVHHYTIPQRQGFFFKISQSIEKIILKESQIHTKDLFPFSLNIQSNKMSQIRFSNHKMPSTFPKNSITWHEAIWRYQPYESVFFS